MRRKQQTSMAARLNCTATASSSSSDNITPEPNDFVVSDHNSSTIPSQRTSSKSVPVSSRRLSPPLSYYCRRFWRLLCNKLVARFVTLTTYVRPQLRSFQFPNASFLVTALMFINTLLALLVLFSLYYRSPLSQQHHVHNRGSGERQQIQAENRPLFENPSYNNHVPLQYGVDDLPLRYTFDSTWLLYVLDFIKIRWMRPFQAAWLEAVSTNDTRTMEHYDQYFGYAEMVYKLKDSFFTPFASSSSPPAVSLLSSLLGDAGGSGGGLDIGSVMAPMLSQFLGGSNSAPAPGDLSGDVLGALMPMLMEMTGGARGGGGANAAGKEPSKTDNFDMLGALMPAVLGMLSSPQKAAGDGAANSASAKESEKATEALDMNELTQMAMKMLAGMR